jgi:hypothetical protein
MTASYARWVLAISHYKSETMKMIARLYKLEIPPQKMKEMTEAQKGLEWAMERAAKVVLDAQEMRS